MSKSLCKDPVLFVNSFWQLTTHMTLLNDTVTTLPMRVDLGNLRNWQFNIMATIETNTKSQTNNSAIVVGYTDSE